MSEPALFPAFLKLEGRRVLLVGGGAWPSSGSVSSTRAGAQVTVVAPEIGPALLSFEGVIVLQREFAPSRSRRRLVRRRRGDARGESPRSRPPRRRAASS